MAVALGVWLCALPFVAFLLVRWVGVPIAAWVVLSLLMVIVGLCWGLCAAKGPGWLRQACRGVEDKGSIENSEDDPHAGQHR